MIKKEADRSKLISISKFSKKHSISTNKLIGHLIRKEKLKNENSTLISNDSFLFSLLDGNRRRIKVNEDKLAEYLKDDLEKLTLQDEEIFTLSAIEDSTILLDRLKNARGKVLMFLDLEYQFGDYSEIAYSIYKEGTLTTREYFFVEGTNYGKKIDTLKENEVPFRVEKKKNINLLLKRLVDKVDYIIAHNSYGERATLARNGISLKKHKFICTADATRKINSLEQDISLFSALERYGVKFRQNLHHFAFYDVIMTKMLFDRLVENQEIQHR